MRFDTWNPGFRGFYNSVWDDDSESRRSESEYVNQEREQLGKEPLDIEFLMDEMVGTADYETYYDGLAASIVSATENGVNEILETKMKFTFQKLNSPAYYNYTNDSIDIEIEAECKEIAKIREYIATHKWEFEQYLKENYTSKSGFNSYYSNRYDDWVAETKDFTDYGKHELGAVLQFILENEHEEWTLHLYCNTEAYCDYGLQKFIEEEV